MGWLGAGGRGRSDQMNVGTGTGPWANLCSGARDSGAGGGGAHVALATSWLCERGQARPFPSLFSRLENGHHVPAVMGAESPPTPQNLTGHRAPSRGPDHAGVCGCAGLRGGQAAALDCSPWAPWPGTFPAPACPGQPCPVLLWNLPRCRETSQCLHSLSLNRRLSSCLGGGPGPEPAGVVSGGAGPTPAMVESCPLS